jgi:hypothetical protein
LVKLQREITRAEEMVRRLEAAAPPSNDEGSPTLAQNAPVRSPARPDAEEDAAAGQIRSQLESNRIEIENLTKEENQLKGLIAQYENRLNRTPYAEQQQAGITRDTEALRAEYTDLQKKQQESQLATNLEKQQGGQQFRLIDPASLPVVPSSPKRMKATLIATALGFALGFGLAFLLEMRNTSFRTEKELTKQFAPPLVVGIPLVSTPFELRRQKARIAMEWLAGSVLLLLVSIAEFYVYKRG